MLQCPDCSWSNYSLFDEMYATRGPFKFGKNVLSHINCYVTALINEKKLFLMLSHIFWEKKILSLKINKKNFLSPIIISHMN